MPPTRLITLLRKIKKWTNPGFMDHVIAVQLSFQCLAILIWLLSGVVIAAFAKGEARLCWLAQLMRSTLKKALNIWYVISGTLKLPRTTFVQSVGSWHITKGEPHLTFVGLISVVLTSWTIEVSEMCQWITALILLLLMNDNGNTLACKVFFP